MQAFAHDPPVEKNQVSFSISTREEVPNDLLVAVLYAQEEGQETKSLSDKVNTAIAWAIGQAKKIDNLKVQTLNYRTTPVYHRNQITGWRVRQSIRLESRDATALSQLLGQLQSRLKLESIGYQVSDELRESTQQELLLKALAMFEKRAELITKALRRPDYELVKVDINTGHDHRPPVPMMRAMAAEAMAAPQIEAGTGTVTLTLTGTIELKLP